MLLIRLGRYTVIPLEQVLTLLDMYTPITASSLTRDATITLRVLMPTPISIGTPFCRYSPPHSLKLQLVLYVSEIRSLLAWLAVATYSAYHV